MKQDYDKYDYLIVMDEANIRNTLRIIGSDPEGKIHKLLQFADNNRRGYDVADPWWTGDFDATYNDVLAGCEGLLAYLLKKGI
jgi:protein-tyrosine phosphatase